MNMEMLTPNVANDTGSVHGSDAASVSGHEEQRTVEFLRESFRIRNTFRTFRHLALADSADGWMPTNAFGRMQFYPKESQGTKKSVKTQRSSTWLISDGLNTGVGLIIGQALRQQAQTSYVASSVVLGVTPWAAVRRRQALINPSPNVCLLSKWTINGM
ncbi:unnamed protein product [Sphagnum balticum]